MLSRFVLRLEVEHDTGPRRVEEALQRVLEQSTALEAIDTGLNAALGEDYDGAHSLTVEPAEEAERVVRLPIEFPPADQYTLDRYDPDTQQWVFWTQDASAEHLRTLGEMTAEPWRVNDAEGNVLMEGNQ